MKVPSIFPIAPLGRVINRRFGTWRGLVRLHLTRLELIAGLGSVKFDIRAPVRRLVFVCHGNICRSAFAEAIARSAGINAISFGLSASSGKSAHDPTIRVANAFGVDLSHHLTTAMEDYLPQPGDLLLAMETRQLRKMSVLPKLAEMPRTLLGLYADPLCPHLHDPYGLDPIYMETCLTRIASSIGKLKAAFPDAGA